MSFRYCLWGFHFYRFLSRLFLFLFSQILLLRLRRLCLSRLCCFDLSRLGLLLSSGFSFSFSFFSLSQFSFSFFGCRCLCFCLFRRSLLSVNSLFFLCSQCFFLCILFVLSHLSFRHGLICIPFLLLRCFGTDTVGARVRRIRGGSGLAYRSSCRRCGGLAR